MKKLAFIALLLALTSCRTVRESTTATASSVRTIHDTIQQHVFVHRTDSVLVWRTDTGTNRREKSQIIVYAADREARHEAQRDTVTNIVYRTIQTSSGSRADILPYILLVILIYIIVKHR